MIKKIEKKEGARVIGYICHTSWCAEAVRESDVPEVLARCGGTVYASPEEGDDPFAIPIVEEEGAK